MKLFKYFQPNTNTLSSLSRITSVVVTDVNGCTKTTEINIDQPDELVLLLPKSMMKVVLDNIQVVMVFFNIQLLEVQAHIVSQLLI